MKEDLGDLANVFAIKGHRFTVSTVQFFGPGTRFRSQDDVASGLMKIAMYDPMLAINVLFPSPVSISATTRKTNVRDGGGVRQLFAAA